MTVDGLPCETCAHFVQRFNNGRVMCQGVFRYIPKKVKTWTMREPCGWTVLPTGEKRPLCSDYTRAKGQMRMEVVTNDRDR